MSASLHPHVSLSRSRPDQTDHGIPQVRLRHVYISRDHSYSLFPSSGRSLLSSSASQAPRSSMLCQLFIPHLIRSRSCNPRRPCVLVPKRTWEPSFGAAIVQVLCQSELSSVGHQTSRVDRTSSVECQAFQRRVKYSNVERGAFERSMLDT